MSMTLRLRRMRLRLRIPTPYPRRSTDARQPSQETRLKPTRSQPGPRRRGLRPRRHVTSQVPDLKPISHSAQSDQRPANARPTSRAEQARAAESQPHWTQRLPGTRRSVGHRRRDCPSKASRLRTDFPGEREGGWKGDTAGGVFSLHARVSGQTSLMPAAGGGNLSHALNVFNAPLSGTL